MIAFLLSFCAAGLAYLLALTRLPRENPSTALLFGFALAFRLILLATPVSLSEDVYRYAWEGHLLAHGVNPYALPVNDPALDAYAIPLRARVAYADLASPYLPAAQVYFAGVAALAPGSVAAFQAAAALLDLAAGVLLLRLLRRVGIADKAVLLYLWNPLVMVEFAHGAHVDALLIVCVLAAVWGLLAASPRGRTLSALALAGAVLVKGWPLLAAPFFVARWGARRALLFGAAVFLPLAVFAAGAGWGLVGPLTGRGVFGALRVYAANWEFNSGGYAVLLRGLTLWLPAQTAQTAARAMALLLPGLLAFWLAWPELRAWLKDPFQRFLRWLPFCRPELAAPARTAPREEAALPSHTPAYGTLHGSERAFIRRLALPLALWLVLAPTVYPWYLTLTLALLPFFWPAADEAARRGPRSAPRAWLLPWLYFTFFSAFTYLAYMGVSAPPALRGMQMAAYLPFWGLLVVAVALNFSEFFVRSRQSNLSAKDPR